MNRADRIYREAIEHGLSERIAAYMAESYLRDDPEARMAWILKQRGEHERMAQHATA